MTNSLAGAPPFSLAVRVYWEDTDAAGIVFYANYLKYFERARTEWLRAKGFSQEHLRTAAGIGFVVADTAVRYMRPARLDDLLDVSVDVTHCGQASLSLVQQAWRRQTAAPPELLAEGTIRIGCVELDTYRPCRIPTDILAAIR